MPSTVYILYIPVFEVKQVNKFSGGNMHTDMSGGGDRERHKRLWKHPEDKIRPQWDSFNPQCEAHRISAGTDCKDSMASFTYSTPSHTHTNTYLKYAHTIAPRQIHINPHTHTHTPRQVPQSKATRMYTTRPNFNTWLRIRHREDDSFWQKEITLEKQQGWTTSRINQLVSWI